MVIVGIIVSIIMFSIIVVLHEYGHYKSARIFGIHVEEFGLGMPPRAKKLWRNASGTLFSLNWLPLGGFVKIAGESEIALEYTNKSGKALSLEDIHNNLKTGKDIYDLKGNIISAQERNYLLAHIKSQKPGENFYEKNIFQKTIVLLAGVIMNFILAALIFTVLFFIGVKPIGVNSILETNTHSKIIPTLEDALKDGLLIEKEGIRLSPLENSRAEKAGIQSGDILISINNNTFSNIQEVQKIISESKNTAISFQVGIPCDTEKCDGVKTKNISITPDENGKIGSYLSPNIVQNHEFIHKYGLADSIKYGLQETYIQTRLTLSGFFILLKNIITPEKESDRQDAINQVAGPIGIVSIVTQSISGGISLLLILAAVISVNLGVFNLLPIPALDGGRILLLWIRAIFENFFGKHHMITKVENLTHITFFILLIALSILIGYNDVIKLID